MSLRGRGLAWGPSLKRRTIWVPLASLVSGSLPVGNIWPGWSPLLSGYSPCFLGQTHGLGTGSLRTSVLEAPALAQTSPGFSGWHEAGITAKPIGWGHPAQAGAFCTRLVPWPAVPSPLFLPDVLPCS